MQTSCGSPCYAAPELVISDGMYVGSAVDIWSCGVILYAMLAGYLPFDDDPANPDGDNINLLYKYIVNTPLSFPDYISAEARDLLSLMLVPDPKNRAGIQTVMGHRWLRPCASLFNRTLADLEHAAMEQHQQKRLAYQRQMKAAASAENQRMARSQSARGDGYANSVGVLPSSTTRSRSHRDYSGSHQQQQVPLYETSNDQPVYTSSPSPQQVNATVPSRRAATSQIVLPTSAFGVDDDPFAPTPSREKPENEFVISPVNDGVVDENTRRRLDSISKNDATPSTSKATATANGTRKASNAGGPPTDQGQRKKKDDFRHTIQVEYNDSPTSESQQLSQSQSSHRQPSQERQPIFPVRASEARANGTRRVSQSKNDSTTRKPVPQTTSPTSTPTSASDIPKIKALPPTPQNNTPRPRATSRGYTAPPDPTPSHTAQPTIEVTAPLSPTSAQPETNGVSDLNISVNGTGSQSAKTHRTGPSLDKIGFGKFFGTTRSATDQTSGKTRPIVNGATMINSRQASESDVPSDASTSGKPRRPSTVQVTTTVTSQSENLLSKSQSSTPGTQNAGGRSPQLLSPVNSSSASATSSKKNRRNTLTVMVEPLSRSIKQRTKSGRAASREPSSKDKDSAGEKSREPSDSLMNQDPPKTAVSPPQQHQNNKFPEVVRPGVGNAASTSKAKKVMEWFRAKSRGRTPDEVNPVTDKSLPTPPPREVPLNASTSTINGLTSPLPAPPLSIHPSSANQDVTTPLSTVSMTPGHTTRTPSVTTEKSFSNPIKRSFILSPAAKNILRVHHGAVDQTTITSGNPPKVMKHVLDVLLDMGLEVQEESQYKFRCVRPKKRKIGSTGVSLKDGQGGNGLAAFSMVGSAASGGVSVFEYPHLPHCKC